MEPVLDTVMAVPIFLDMTNSSQAICIQKEFKTIIMIITVASGNIYAVDNGNTLPDDGKL